MSRNIATIWEKEWPADLVQRLTFPERPLQVFFRADDIAATDDRFLRMCRLFQRHRCPLNLAVVPAWMTRQRWQAMEAIGPDNPHWCWHQHGFAHRNHTLAGKKGEFGSQRLPGAIRRDLQQGRDHLQAILGDAFFPVFTPPWNRCSQQTLDLLPELGFLAISRFTGARPPAPPSLPDLQCNLDLHTRKETEAAVGWHNLISQWQKAVSSGSIGIMLHHEQMNDRAFAFVDLLLGLIGSVPQARPATFRELLSR